MDTALWEKIITTAAGTGLGSLVLVFGLYYLHRGNLSLLEDLKTERGARVTVLEKRSDDCAADRAALHKEVSSLQTEVRGMYDKFLDVIANRDRLQFKPDYIDSGNNNDGLHVTKRRA